MTHTRPIVSVIIITYNQEATIARAIDSILAQTGLTDYEIIIGDDASTDGTREICDEYAGLYPHIIRLMPPSANKGLVDNYFDCVESARGKYIADCAGDDYWCNTSKLAVMTKMLDENPDVTAVYSDTVFRWPDGTEKCTAETGRRPFCLRDTVRSEGKDVLVAALDNVNALPYILSSAIFRRDAVMNIMEKAPEMVRNNSFGIEDVPVIAALASQGAALHFPEPTLVYEQRPESVSNSASLTKLVKFYCRSLECSRQLAAFYNIPQIEIKANFDSKSRYLTAIAFNSGNREAMSLVAETLRRWDLRLPFTARIYLLAFRCLPLRWLLTAVKRLFRR